MTTTVMESLKGLDPMTDAGRVSMLQDLHESLVSESPYYWALAHRVLKGERYTFEMYPFLEAFHEDDSEDVCAMKGAQLGFTVALQNIAFYHIDKGRDVLYLMPTDSDASDFSAARLNPAIAETPRMEQLARKVDNVGHKRFGRSNLYLRGSNSKARLKQIDVAVELLDEYDEMDKDQVALVLERMSGQIKRWLRRISTPSAPGLGIAGVHDKSDQKEWFIRCPHCNRHINLEWDRNVFVETAELFCHECDTVIDHGDKVTALSTGEWVAKNPGRDRSGYHISQLYSPTLPIEKLVEAYLEAETDPGKLTVFMNNKLGLPHEASGTKLTDEMVKACMGNYRTIVNAPIGSATMGVDVGSRLHYVIADWPDSGRVKRILCIGEVTDFEELDVLMQQYLVNCVVVDALPETRKAREFVQRYPGVGCVCWYPEQRREILVDWDNQQVSVPRTESLDATLTRYRSKTVTLPVDMPAAYSRHLRALVRVYKEQPNTGQLIARYVRNGDDHWAHADNYCEIAHALRPSFVPDIITVPSADGTFNIG